MLCTHNFPKHIVPSKFEAESVLSNVLKYGQSRPKRAYKARAYKARAYKARAYKKYGKSDYRQTDRQSKL